MDSISLITNNNMKYFPIALHTLDYNDGNKSINKKANERTSEYIIRLSKTRSDKRFCCVGTSCSFKLQIQESELPEGEENPYEQIALPRKIESGSIILEMNSEKNTPILTFENQKFVLKRIQLFQDTLFTWNQNEDVDKNTRDIYLHDGELHLHMETFNPGKPKNIVIVIGLKNDANGVSILPGSLQNKSNSTTFKIEELFPNVMSFFTYDMDNSNTRVIVMENFVLMNNFENMVQIIQERGSTLPSDINQPLVRPLDTKNLAMYGFLKVNTEKRKGDYNDKVYYQNEKRIRYNPNIIESNRVKKAQDKIFFTIKIPPNFKLVRKDDIGPLQSFLNPYIFNSVYIVIMLLCGGVVYIQGLRHDNFWNMVIFTFTFWLAISIGFIIALASARGYYKKQLSALPTNDPERETKKEELNEKINKIANPGTFIITVFSVLAVWILLYTTLGYFMGINRQFFNSNEAYNESYNESSNDSPGDINISGPSEQITQKSSEGIEPQQKISEETPTVIIPKESVIGEQPRGQQQESFQSDLPNTPDLPSTVIVPQSEQPEINDPYIRDLKGQSYTESELSRLVHDFGF
jgi:hypothetical protein